MYNQIIAHTPLAGNAAQEFIFKRLTGHESLSSLYHFTAEFLSRNNDLDLDALLGQDICLEIPLLPQGCRYLHGHITAIEFSGYELQAEKYRLYTVTLRPALWYLTQNRDCRIWQEKTLPDIIGAILDEFSIRFENQLTSQYHPYPFCVQYQESTFDFLSRLMEHEGIYYYFKHHDQGHTLVLADSPQAHGPFKGYDTIDYRQAGMDLNGCREGIYHWMATHQITPRLCSVDDYDFKKPRAHLAQTCQSRASFARGKTELFDWPGHYDDHQQGQFLAHIRQQACEAAQRTVAGRTTARGVAPGFTFHIRHCPRPSDELNYLVTGVEYSLCDSRYHCHDNLADGESAGIVNLAFTVVPATTVWRPARSTPWPKTHGPQTAEVAGPVGKAVWTDKYGRVKVKFRWDRRGNGDDTGSCWVRVSSQWAGWKYGNVQVPRVGEEVIVDFINGDPDRPIITGRVYNEDAMPPWDLPAAATKMGFMSRSKAGGVGNASFWFMEDAPGREAFALHAERDMNITVERHKNITVDGDLARQVKGKTRFIHLGSCTTSKLQPDLQTFHLGKTSMVTAGGRASGIVGGDYHVVAGSAHTFVSDHHCLSAGKTMSHHALDCLMFDAGNKIIFGASLELSPAERTGDNLAQQTLAPCSGITARDITDRRVNQQQQSRREPTRMVYTKGVNREINGVDKQHIQGDQDIEVQGDVSRRIKGNWNEQAERNYTLRTDGDTTINCGGETLIETKNLVHKIEGHVETHSGNVLNMTGSMQSINSMSFTLSQMAVESHQMLTSSHRMHLCNTDMRMETVGINISKGQLDMRNTLLSLNTSAITLFI
ncbi:type VI secretion system tip protein TssI/VgrG [Acerihabitans sp. TG2]|uniref:type VI secretion system Vgr family protein n=1 Tax=Acerihabitans sp. TG2 TaxID=3096008 RepID=UPI002B22D088|nr:type VI secretion system tip protein TssI/VgrG [Acerihabitans sp. TG2]MEA9390968.1 type VI secretion system tip protein TssI/VgrG [Acerihabitans sp. TG2]